LKQARCDPSRYITSLFRVARRKHLQVHQILLSKHELFYSTMRTVTRAAKMRRSVERPRCSSKKRVFGITRGSLHMKNNQQTNLKEPSLSLHYTTQRTHARLFVERGAAFLPRSHSHRETISSSSSSGVNRRYGKETIFTESPD